MDVSVLLVGCLEQEPPGGAWIVDGIGMRRVDDLQQAVVALDEGWGPLDLIVLAESRPGEYSATSIDELRACAPLARVWRLLGSWCEGEQRSGHPPAGCINTYWHQWEPRGPVAGRGA